MYKPLILLIYTVKVDKLFFVVNAAEGLVKYQEFESTRD